MIRMPIAYKNFQITRAQFSTNPHLKKGGVYIYETLSEKKQGLLWQAAHKYRAACSFDNALDAEDLAQIGLFGFAKAYRTHDPSRGKVWNTWALWPTPPPGRHNRAAWDAITTEAAKLASEHNNDPFLIDLLCAVVDEIERGSRLENAEQ